MEFTIRMPSSTSNLGPGFDALGLALAFYNTAHVSVRDGNGVRFALSGEGVGVLPEDESNLFYQAALQAARAAGRSLPGFDVEMHNRVLLARGLGSSASAVVGGLVAANKLVGAPLSRAEILELATKMEGHPDNVSPCLYGGLTVSAIRDGHVTCIRSEPPDDLEVVMAMPDFEIETSAARELLPETVPHQDAVFNVSRTAVVTAALISGDLDALEGTLDDRLHQPYRLSLVPGFEEVRQAAVSAGAFGAFLSGAGPAILAFVRKGTEGVAEAMQTAWQQARVAARAETVEIDRTGVVLE